MLKRMLSIVWIACLIAVPVLTLATLTGCEEERVITTHEETGPEEVEQRIIIE